jgi:hypothetical protein
LAWFQRFGQLAKAGLGKFGMQWDFAAQQVVRDASEDEHGVGHRGQAAAAAVAQRAGVRASAGRADSQPSIRCASSDRAAPGADRDDVDHRDLDREATHAAVGGQVRRAALDHRHVGAGATPVEGQHFGKTGRAGQQRGAQGACGGPAQQRADRLARHLRGRDDAPVRFHDVERQRGSAARSEPGAELAIDLAHVACDARFDEGIHQGRHGPLVLAVLGQHLGRDGHARRGEDALDDLAHAPFVGAVGVGVQQAHPDARDAARLKPAGGAFRVVFVQRLQHLAAEVEPLGDLAHLVQRHDALGLDPEVGISVALGDALARDLEQVAEAAGDDQAQAGQGALFGQQGVGGHGGAVRDGAHVAGREAGRVGALADAGQEAG